MLFINYCKKILTGFLFFITLFIISISCDSTEPPANISLTLKLEDVSCTEAWLQLNTTNLQLPNNVTVYINDLQSRTFNLTTADTLLYIDSLLPNQNYSFQIISFYNPEDGIKSNKVNATTTDTTFHNFTWEIETVGDYGSYALDVAVVDENNVWLVGQFYQQFGSDTVFNAAHWDGNTWELILIPIKAFGGHYSRAPLRAIFYVGNELWVIGDAGGYAHLKNNNWFTEFNDAASATTNKIWGSSINNIFFIGPGGAITHYNGNNFTKMESNTNVNLTDIYGTPDGKEVWACGWNSGDGNSVLLSFNGNEWEKIYERYSLTNNLPYNSFISTLWIGNNKEFFLTGIANGIVKHSILDKRMARTDIFTIQNFAYNIRGNGINDIFLAGDAAMMWHFNGVNWKQYIELQNENNILRSMSLRGNIIIAAGLNFSDLLSKALVIKGRKSS